MGGPYLDIGGGATVILLRFWEGKQASQQAGRKTRIFVLQPISRRDKGRVAL